MVVATGGRFFKPPHVRVATEPSAGPALLVAEGKQHGYNLPVVRLAVLPVDTLPDVVGGQAPTTCRHHVGQRLVGLLLEDLGALGALLLHSLSF